MSSIRPLVSVVTVVFNGEKYLEETIQSVINQTYDNVEYIIIDGGSTDGTLDIIKKYEDRIDYWVSERDRGIYDAMNKGIDLASGEWINFMNAGDGLDSYSILNEIFSNKINLKIGLIYGNTNTGSWYQHSNARYWFKRTNRLTRKNVRKTWNNNNQKL